MKKFALFMAIILLLSNTLTAYAAVPEDMSPLSLKIIPMLNFDGNTANCVVNIISSNANDSISATIKLWQGSTCIITWNTSSQGYLHFSASEVVVSGLTYKLTADVVINGITKPTVSITKLC